MEAVHFFSVEAVHIASKCPLTTGLVQGILHGDQQMFDDHAQMIYARNEISKNTDFQKLASAVTVQPTPSLDINDKGLGTGTGRG